MQPNLANKLDHRLAGSLDFNLLGVVGNLRRYSIDVVISDFVVGTGQYGVALHQKGLLIEVRKLLAICTRCIVHWARFCAIFFATSFVKKQELVSCSFWSGVGCAVYEILQPRLGTGVFDWDDLGAVCLAGATCTLGLRVISRMS